MYIIINFFIIKVDTDLADAKAQITNLTARIATLKSNYVDTLNLNVLRPALLNFYDIKMCISAIKVIGKITSVVTVQFARYSDKVVPILLAHLPNSQVDLKVKAASIPCLKDIALAIRDDFGKYLKEFMKVTLNLEISWI